MCTKSLSHCRLQRCFFPRLSASVHCIYLFLPLSLSHMHTQRRTLIPQYAPTNSLINIPFEDESRKLLLMLWFPP